MRRSSLRKARRGRRTARKIARKDGQSQAHVKWDYKDHVVILLK